MADIEHPALSELRPAAEPCWMCGIRLPAAQMVTDGGSACRDLRWYCLDVRGCTERWTVRAAEPDWGRDAGWAAVPQAGP